MSDIFSQFQKLSPEERAQMLALLQSGGDVVGGDKISGDKVLGDKIEDRSIGVNLGTVIYGRDPSEEEREYLVRYLSRLAAKLRRLPMSSLSARLDDGEGVAMPKVYVMLAVTGDGIEVTNTDEPDFIDYFQDETQNDFKLEFDPDWSLPDKAIVDIDAHLNPAHAAMFDEDPGGTLLRARLASEAVAESEHMVLLGDPGSGKSIFLRHLAWVLAMRGLNQSSETTQLLGWENAEQHLPVILPLRRLAGRIDAAGAGPATVSAALVEEMTREYDARHADHILDQALAHGATFIMFDGLDEVPLQAIAGVTASRHVTLKAVKDFAELHGIARILVTCRTRAFDEELRHDLDWNVETLASLTLGQIRHFINEWFTALVERGSLMHEQGAVYHETLEQTIVANDKLRKMAENPLLLTMMALVLVEKGELPRDRPLLYERIMEQLLGQWDQHKGGQTLAEVVGSLAIDSSALRPILDELSYQAHLRGLSGDGRGRLPADELRLALTKYLSQVRVEGAWEAAGRCLDYFNHRSGLLLPEEDGNSYAFAHLTLQEHGAGRHMLLQPNAVANVMQHRADDRWREPISLGLGVLQRLHAPLSDRLDRVLTELIDRDEDGAEKPIERWYRDLILAAELAAERDWNLLRGLAVNVDRLQRDLRHGLVALLADTAQPLPVAERVRAGFLLGELGDPRYPVTLDEWRAEWDKAQRGDTDGYFCRVDAGTYTIGSADDDPDARDEEKPQHVVTFDAPFWIGRFPITNAQWHAWVAVGGAAPEFADDSDLNHANQPVVGVSWDICNQFCAWLSEQLDLDARLPTEQEWEAAARGGDARRYPWSDNWHDDHAAMKEDRDVLGWDWSVPVGCYSAGAAPCGTLDMAGNVWEWTSSTWESYPDADKSFIDKGPLVLRGGCYVSERLHVRCGARDWEDSSMRSDDAGFRTIITPHIK